MSDAAITALDARTTRDTFAVQTADGAHYVVVTYADPDGHAYLGVNGGVLEPVILGGSYHDVARFEPVIACGQALVASRFGREPLDSAPVESIVLFGADTYPASSLESRPIGDIDHAAHLF